MNIKDKDYEIDDSEEKNLDAKKFKVKIKNFWENYKTNWVWVNIGALSMFTFFIWLLFLLDIFTLIKVILYTLLYPSLLILGYYGKKSSYKDRISKILFIGGGGYVITLLIWLFAGYFLFYSSWALFQNAIPNNLEWAFDLIIMGIVYGVVMFLLYRFGKKKEWNFIP